jgi:SAM-dependent MidA family methyltransferase
METSLKDFIIREIREKGPIPFSRYMEICLYHPELGYYQRQEPITGPAGDFYTAPHVHALFGQTIGRWIHRVASDMGLEEVTVLELGPGNGQLAMDILGHWTDDRQALSMILVEEDGPRKRDLEARFAGCPVRVTASMEMDELSPIVDVVLANEFFDALPLKIYTRRNSQIMEVFVDLSGDSFIEVHRPAGEPEDIQADILSRIPEGFRTEISLHWYHWLERIGRVLRRGYLLLLDYGELIDGLLVPWRMEGTLRCYQRHQVDTNPYENPGKKDITAHVNFSLIQSWALKADLKVQSFTSQSSFLIKSGILDLLAQQMDQLPEREATGLWLTVKNLIHEEGMGEIFKAMVLEKKG